jgi:hypothetical protein
MPCSNSFSAGGSSPIAAFSFGKSGYDKACEARQDGIVEFQKQMQSKEFEWSQHVFDVQTKERQQEVAAQAAVQATEAIAGAAAAKAQSEAAIAQAQVNALVAVGEARTHALEIACQTAPALAQAAQGSYDRVLTAGGELSKNPVAKSVIANEGTLAVGGAASALTQANTCAEGTARMLGIQAPDAAKLPAITIEELKAPPPKPHVPVKHPVVKKVEPCTTDAKK